MSLASRLNLFGGVGQPYGFELGSGPNLFSFGTLGGQALDQVGVTSGEITISGVVAGSTISVVGDAGYGYSLNGGAYVTTDGVVSDGDTLSVRVNASDGYSRGRSVTVTINEVVVTFVVVTIKDPNPPAIGRTVITRLHTRR